MAEETQDNEILVLQSMYLENFTSVETKSAWSKRSDKSFRLKLFASSNESVLLTLCVTLTATYPKTVPLLKVKDMQNVRQKYADRLNGVLVSKPKELVGEVMIYDITIELENILEEAAEALALSAQTSSLEEERAIHEAAVAKRARDLEEEQAKKDRQAQIEQEHKVQQMVEEELRKRDLVKQKRANEVNVEGDEEDLERKEKGNAAASAHATVSFDQPVTVEDFRFNEHIFRTISVSSQMPSWSVSNVYRATPLSIEPLPVSLVLKTAKIKSDCSKKSVVDFERLLEELKSMRHANIINVLAFKIQSKDNIWTVDILTESASKGSLESMLSVVDRLSVQKAKTFAVELSHAIDFYHKSGIVHGLIHLRNVLFCQNSSGNPVLRLSDAAFESSLHDIADFKVSRTSSSYGPSSWSPPELLTTEASGKSRKSDMWDFGVVFLQMMFGLDVKQNFSSPKTFLFYSGLSDTLDELAKDLLRDDPRKRPDAEDILSYEFMRTEAALLGRPVSHEGPRKKSFGEVLDSRPQLHKESSTGNAAAASRYATDWDESGRLGKGGFGEVVKARHKNDGRFYAIKKILQKSPAELRQVLSEVRHLARLNHPYVVRYYTAWIEEDESLSAFGSAGEATSSLESDSDNLENHTSTFGYGPSTGGLDFISSSGYPRIEFGEDDDDVDGDDDDDDDEEDEAEGETPEDESDELDSISKRHQQNSLADPSTESENLRLKRTRSESRVMVTSTLYIQMELCEKRTLRDVIRKGIFESADEVWRMFRQILEGLAHIHSNGIIHRDLKPENIFIDVADNPKLGDFGLAKSPVMGSSGIMTRANGYHEDANDLTRSIGTTLYVAPELRSNAAGLYDSKVDMYSLGIIFFEMCFPLRTGMERVQTLGSIREKQHKLPEIFQNSEKAVQGEIIDSLLHHKPSERPSSSELLKGGKVPVQIEDDTIRLALEALADDSSPYYHKMMAALFSKDQYVREQVWDSGNKHAQSVEPRFMMLQSAVRDRLVTCFRRHGAVEAEVHGLVPSSSYYASNPNVVQLLNSSGTLVQLPHDLTLPHARLIAKHGQLAEKSFTFGSVYREESGGAPKSVGECDFDIISYNNNDLALKEAETIKVMDEILNEIPPLASTNMCFHISHSTLLDTILEFCRVATAQRQITKEILGRLNIQHFTWQKIRLELRSPSVGVSSTSIDEIARFDFRDTAEKAFKRLQSIFIGTGFLSRLHDIFTHISGLVEYCKQMGIKRPIYFSPLSSFNDKFYVGGVMFQCLFDAKKRDVLAAGGRYDQLLESFRPKVVGTPYRSSIHGVGINVAWDRIVASVMRWQKNTLTVASQYLKRSEEADASKAWTLRRCDVLIASFDKSILRSTGVKLVSELWAYDFSSELAIDFRSPEELYSHYRDSNHSWIIIIKHDNNNSAKPDLKVRCSDKGEFVDVWSSELLTFLRAELRERDQRENRAARQQYTHHYHHHGGSYHGGSYHGGGSGDHGSGGGSGGDGVAGGDHASKRRDVRVLLSNHKSKKWNKWRVVETAQEKSQELTRSFANAPIASIEVRDEVLEAIRATRLSDPESWRKVIQDVPLSERQYLQEIHELLSRIKYQHGNDDDGARNCFVFNFRSAACILYDLKL